ncbi:C-type lectin BpLec-like [Dunckerocampus dactyliophorus]|uniref:C-type lectin BpLec-like n=1 Tax=Dunckerocampus dactyliophorus TaxID=161453 RepID=UPI002406FEFE|nr:C-type lectin BpLec-like [Dunckerocampus dactyliophorus]
MKTHAMLLALILFRSALGAEPPSAGPEVKLQRGDCPLFWFSFNGRCYKYVSTGMKWADAELHCMSQKAHLVSIHSLEEDNFVKVLIRNFDPAEKDTWIGLSDVHKEGRWMWSDGSRVNFGLWSPNQPDNYNGYEHCVATNYRNGRKWNDGHCTNNNFAFVCASLVACL